MISDAASIGGSVPLWATLLVGLGSGLIGTFATISHERGAEFRTRRLSAAEDLVRAAERFRRTFASPPMSWTPDGYVSAVRDAADEVAGRQALIELLYGIYSPVTFAGNDVRDGAEQVWEEITDACAGLSRSHTVLQQREAILAALPNGSTSRDALQEALRRFQHRAAMDVQVGPIRRSFYRTFWIGSDALSLWRESRASSTSLGLDGSDARRLDARDVRTGQAAPPRRP